VVTLKHELRLSRAVLTPDEAELLVHTRLILALDAELTTLDAARTPAAKLQIVRFAKKSGFLSVTPSKFLAPSTVAKRFASKFHTLYAELFVSHAPSRFLFAQLATYVSRSHVLSITAQHDSSASHAPRRLTTAPHESFVSLRLASRTTALHAWFARLRQSRFLSAQLAWFARQRHDKFLFAPHEWFAKPKLVR
jgi:hypothetical protein